MNSTAFIFPGQGSQSIGMLFALAENYSLVSDIFNRASDALGYDLWDLIQNGPHEKLNQTEFTQAAMLASDVAIFEVIQKSKLIVPSYMAGHSLGEYAALVCAGSLTLEDASKLVATRGRLMQEHVPLGEGAMAAIIGMSNEDVSNLCIKASSEHNDVTPANYNAPGQVVVAGHSQAVEHVVTLAQENGARMATIIPVSVPCHCALLKKAAEAFENDLKNTPFKSPQFNVISNVDLSIYQSPEQIRQLLKQQLYSPVRWVETIQLMKDNGVEQVIESGPGKVLTGLVKRIDKTIKGHAVNDPSSLKKALSHFN